MYADHQKYIPFHILQMYEFKNQKDIPLLWIGKESEMENQIDSLMLKGNCVLKKSVRLLDAAIAKANGIDIFSPETNPIDLKKHPEYRSFIRSRTRPYPIIGGKIKCPK